ncbi:cupin domain-containing protein [Nocardia sp. NPDC049220]|uniref:cupin domain-containing protein n=1 Tax=Nocardia sp. NPDC049220 TaxID=3155273 RepID=UPI0033F81C7C
MTKPEIEFTPVEKTDFTLCSGHVPGLTERILATDPESGTATRILRFAPNTDTTPNGVQVHDFWEEVYILEGEMTDLRLGQIFSAGQYACRPPGMAHGPWTSGPQGCLTFEVRYR